MQTKRVYLTRGEDRKFVLSSREPVVALIEGTRRMGLYPRVETSPDGELSGEPFWDPGNCAESARELFLGDGPLPPFNEPIPVTMTGELTRATWTPLDHEERGR